MVWEKHCARSALSHSQYITIDVMIFFDENKMRPAQFVIVKKYDLYINSKKFMLENKYNLARFKNIIITSNFIYFSHSFN